MVKARHYILTQTAEQDFYQAKRWSISRSGVALTKEYFNDLHHAAEYVAAHHATLPEREDITGESGLGIHPVREHYIIYVPAHLSDGDKKIIIVALIRQTRDVPNILKANRFIIERELRDILP